MQYKLTLTFLWLMAMSFDVFSESLKQTENNKISWQTYHRPPGIIKEGIEQGSGFVEKALGLIIKQMPEYHHDFPIASLTRALTDIKTEKNVCHPALYKTKEREKYIVYSNASIINPSNRVIARKGTFDQYAEGKYIDLKKVLDSGQFSFSLIKQRSYGQDVDDKIAGHYINKNSQLLASTELGTVFQMVKKKRVDFTIAFPFELNYFIEKNKIKDDVFASYYIKDIPTYTLGYVACPKNEWGKKVITRVNKVLNEIKHTNDYKQAITSWWKNEQSSKEFEDFYTMRFITN